MFDSQCGYVGEVTRVPSRRGPYAKTAARIERILDASLEVFAAKGYRASTMKEIAERVGLSQTGLMHHFPVKADVLVALLRRRDEQASQLAAAANPLAPLDRVLANADEIHDNPSLAALYCVVSAEAIAPDHPAHDYFKDRYGTVVRRATTALTALRRQGGLREDVDPASLARLMIGVLDGLQLQWLLDQESVDIKAELRTFLSAWFS